MRFFPIVTVVVTFGWLGLMRTSAGSDGFTELMELSSGHAAQCDRDSMQLRLAALSAVQHMDASSAMPILESVLARRDECSLELRRKAVFHVAQQDVSGVEALLLTAARTDPDAEVRRKAVFWLSEVPGEGAVVALDSILQASDDREVQEKAIFALSQHESARSNEILRGYVAQVDAPESLREKAIFWLGSEGSRGDQAYLRDLYASLSSVELKEKIISGVSQNADTESSAWLMARFQDENESISLRKKALFWLAQEGDITSTELKDLYEATTDYELKQQVLFGLSERHGASGIDQLMEIARTETNVELQKKAIFWLGQSNDPRAGQFLLDLIER